MIDDRVITDFAERLVPEAFTRPHSAYRVEVVDASARGPDAFDRWVGDRLAEVPSQRYAWGGRPIYYVVVESADGTRWRWDDAPCCEVAWFAARVRDESAQLAEPWVFAVELDWPDEILDHEDPGSGGHRQLAEPPVDWPATWYAEARGRGVSVVTAGRLWIDASDRIVLEEPLPPRQGVPGAFHRVLHGHPDRKRYPLRRPRR